MWDYYTSKHYFAGFDGNGNVTVLVDAANQAVGAQYEYSPFGETLRATGAVAKSNPFRFSSKFTDQESDLVYYGYRYYSPSLMRWVNRDPIEEGGGSGLYAFVFNNPPNLFDIDGRVPKGIITLGEMLPGTFSTLAGRYNQHTMSSLARVRNFNDIVASADEWALAIGTAGAGLAHVGVETLHAGTTLAKAVWDSHVQAANEFLQHSADYYRNTIAGETAWADLDAVAVAASLMNMTGDYVLAYAVLDVLY